MILEELNIENFLGYYGKSNTFTFSEGINIIAGENGYGKSGIYDAIYWVIHDKCYIKKYGYKPTNVINDIFINDKYKYESDDGVIECSVTLTFFDEKNSHRYILTRKLKGNKKANNITYGSKSILTVKEKKRNLDSQFVDSEEGKKRILVKILPDNIKDYMWFQGEAIESIIDFSSTDSLSKAINLLSDITTYDHILEVFESFQSNRKRKLDKEKNKRSKNKDRSETLDEEIEKLEVEIRGIRTLLRAYEEDKLKVDRNYENILSKTEASKKITKLEAEINIKKEEVAKLLKQVDEDRKGIHDKIFENKWILSSQNDNIESYLEKYRKYQNDRATARVKIENAKEPSNHDDLLALLPANMPKQNYLEDMIASKQCFVCGQKFLENSEAHKIIQSQIDKNDPLDEDTVETIDSKVSKNSYEQDFNALQEHLISAKSMLNNIPQQIKVYEDNISVNESLYNEADLELGELENELDEVIRTEQISSIDAASNVEQIRTIVENRGQLKTDIELKKEEIKSKQEALMALESEKDKLVVSDLDPQILLASKVAEYLAELASSTRERVFSDLINELERDANDHFQRMSKGNLSARGTIKIVKVNNNYTYDVVDELGNSMKRTNTGNDVLVVLSTIMAIISARKTTSTSSLYTLISDAPFSSLGIPYTLGATKEMSKIYKQSIITSKEYYSLVDLREQLFNDEEVNLGTFYMIKPDLIEENRNSRNQTIEIEKIR